MSWYCSNPTGTQSPPVPVTSSSTVLSQSSSMLLHTSAVPLWLPTQTIVPPWHSNVPAPHWPAPHVLPIGGPSASSMNVSQSSSRPLHTSTPGWTFGAVQASPPAPSHTSTPCAKHAPISPLSHVLPRPRPLSTCPSQSSSMPLHTSVPGPTSPTHAPSVLPLHVWMPVWHVPWHTPVVTSQPVGKS